MVICKRYLVLALRDESREAVPENWLCPFCHPERSEGE